MGVKFELLAAGDKYTNQKGEEKTRWIKCGVMLDNGNIKIESIPASNWNGWLTPAEPKKDSMPGKQVSQSNDYPKKVGLEDETPPF